MLIDVNLITLRSYDFNSATVMAFPPRSVCFRVNRFDQRMRRQEFREAAPQRAGAVAVNDAHARLARKRGIVEKFVDAAAWLLRPCSRSR